MRFIILGCLVVTGMSTRPWQQFKQWWRNRSALHPTDEEIPILEPAFYFPSIAHWTKSLELFPENIFGTNNHRRPTVLEKIYGTNRSAVYTIAGVDDKWVVKYAAYCPHHDGFDNSYPDPVARESYFLRILNLLDPSIGIAHLFTSGAVVVPRGQYGKIVIQCGPNELPMVRYMILERVGVTLMHLLTSRPRLSLEIAAACTLQVVRQLEKLHSLGIVHGDVHVGNVGIRNTDPRSLTLIDFGSTRLGSDVPKLSAQRYFDKPFCHPIVSMWEAEHFEGSFRDDIFRAVQMMAMLAHGAVFVRHLQTLCTSQYTTRAMFDQYVAMKRDSNLFDFRFRVPTWGGGDSFEDSYSMDKIKSVTSENIYELRKIIDKLMESVRDAPTTDSLPHYADIERYLQDIVELIRGPTGEGKDPAEVIFI